MFPIHLTSYPAWQKYLFSWHHKLKDISDIIPRYFSKTYSLHHRRSKNNGFLNQKTKVLRIQIYLLYKQLEKSRTSTGSIHWCRTTPSFSHLWFSDYYSLIDPSLQVRDYCSPRNSTLPDPSCRIPKITTQLLCKEHDLQYWSYESGFFLSFHIPCADRRKQLLSIKSVTWLAWTTLFFWKTSNKEIVRRYWIKWESKSQQQNLLSPKQCLFTAFTSEWQVQCN